MTNHLGNSFFFFQRKKITFFLLLCFWLCCEQRHLLVFWCSCSGTVCCSIKPQITTDVIKSATTEVLMGYNLFKSAYLPMYRDGEDGLDVGQHCFELLRILLEAHFCQYQRLTDILDEKENKRSPFHKWKPSNSSVEKHRNTSVQCITSASKISLCRAC